MFKLKFEQTILLGFIFAFGLLALAGILSYRRATVSMRTSQQVIQSQVVLKELETTLSIIEAAESRMKTYIISGKENHLQQYNSYKARIHDQLKHLEELTANDSIAVVQVSELERMFDAKVDFIASVMEMRKQGRTDEMNAALEIDSDKATVDDLVEKIEQIKKDVGQKLVSSEQKSLRISRQTRITLQMLIGLSLALLTTGYFLIKADIRERRKAEQKLLQTTNELRKFAVHLDNAREEERAHVSREIHDQLGQLLTVMQFDLKAMWSLASPRSQNMRKRIKEMDQVVDQSMQVIKRISSALRPPQLDDLGLVESLRWHLRDFCQRTKMEHTFAVEPQDLVCETELSTILFRILQEALTNIARHAKATLVEVSLKRSQNELVLRVADNGRGISGQQVSGTGSLGLVGIRERIRPWGGRLEIAGQPGKGTILMVSIPKSLKETGDEHTAG
jgi:signal transduction histidine kinase